MKKTACNAIGKIIITLLSLSLAFSLSACGKNKKAAATASASPGATPSSAAVQTGKDGGMPIEEKSEQANAADSTPKPTLAPSSNKTVIKNDDEAPTVYWAVDISYHLKGCPELEGKDVSEVSWAMVKEIGLRQCPVCNPPQYENYVENNG